MTEALVDTDILSYYFKGHEKVIENFRDYLKEYGQINISIITFYEMIAGLKSKRATRQIGEFEDFVKNNSVIHFSESSARISGDIFADLRTRGINIGASDLLIAGIAIENNLALITNNLKHYSSINDLQVENWAR